MTSNFPYRQQHRLADYFPSQHRDPFLIPPRRQFRYYNNRSARISRSSNTINIPNNVNHNDSMINKIILPEAYPYRWVIVAIHIGLLFMILASFMILIIVFAVTNNHSMSLIEGATNEIELIETPNTEPEEETDKFVGPPPPLFDDDDDDNIDKRPPTPAPPPSQYPSSSKCETWGGSCQSTNRFCNGIIIKHACRGENCMCCLPHPLFDDDDNTDKRPPFSNIEFSGLAPPSIDIISCNNDDNIESLTKLQGEEDWVFGPPLPPFNNHSKILTINKEISNTKLSGVISPNVFGINNTINWDCNFKFEIKHPKGWPKWFTDNILKDDCNDHNDKNFYQSLKQQNQKKYQSLRQHNKNKRLSFGVKFIRQKEILFDDVLHMRSYNDIKPLVLSLDEDSWIYSLWKHNPLEISFFILLGGGFAMIVLDIANYCVLYRFFPHLDTSASRSNTLYKFFFCMVNLTMIVGFGIVFHVLSACVQKIVAFVSEYCQPVVSTRNSWHKNIMGGFCMTVVFVYDFFSILIEGLFNIIKPLIDFIDSIIIFTKNIITTFMEFIINLVSFVADPFNFGNTNVQSSQQQHSSSPLAIIAYNNNHPYFQQRQPHHRAKFPKVSLASDQSDKNIKKNKEEEESCVVCMTEQKTCVFIPCKHHCICVECSLIYKTQNIKICPMCRGEFTEIMKIYS